VRLVHRDAPQYASLTAGILRPRVGVGNGTKVPVLSQCGISPRAFVTPCVAGVEQAGSIGSSLVHWVESHVTKDANVRTAILVLALALMFVPFLSACPFSMYPGAKRVSHARHTGRAIAYSTPDAYEKVIEYYKKDWKVIDNVPGAAEVHFDDGPGIFIRDMKQEGTTVVVPRPKKK
jgi:hypothetical protein